MPIEIILVVVIILLATISLGLTWFSKNRMIYEIEQKNWQLLKLLKKKK